MYHPYIIDVIGFWLFSMLATITLRKVTPLSVQGTLRAAATASMMNLTKRWIGSFSEGTKDSGQATIKTTIVAGTGDPYMANPGRGSSARGVMIQE